MKIFPLHLFLLLILFSFFIPSSAWARHKCPKVPAPTGFFGIFTTTTLLPSGTFMATARVSQTSGCGKGHPSSDFYKPSIGRMELYLEDTLAQVNEESTQGRGTHLDALVLLAGCPTESSPAFSGVLQSHYSSVFSEDLNSSSENTGAVSPFRTIAERIFILKRIHPRLSSSCEQG